MTQNHAIAADEASDAHSEFAGMPFVKMHGLGNDFVVLDLRRSLADGRIPAIEGAAARAIADRHLGVGCDQVIALEPPRDDSADIFMRIANADGSESDACGNAARCVASLMFDELRRDRAIIETEAGLLPARAESDGTVTVDMGEARSDWQDIPLAREVDTDHIPVDAGPLKDGVGVNIGNPHAVFFVDRADPIDLAAWGPRLESDPMFPERANIGVAEIRGDGDIRLRVWERGVGQTLACGSAACAVVVAATRRGLAHRSATVRVDGGELQILWRDDGHVEMRGAVATSFTGELDRSIFAAA